MIPDPFTRELERRLPWGYDDLHRWLGILAALGATAEQAAELLDAIAAHGGNPDDVVAEATRCALA